MPRTSVGPTCADLRRDGVAQRHASHPLGPLMRVERAQAARGQGKGGVSALEREASWHKWLNLWQNIFGSRLSNHTGGVNRADVSAHFPPASSARVEHERVPSR